MSRSSAASSVTSRAVTTSSSLFRPITIGKHIQLPNRFVMQPMYLNMEYELKYESADMMNAMATFFEERAHYGAKLIILGGIGTSRLGRWRSGSLMLTSFDDAKAFSTITRAIHKEDGYVLAQAFHAGRAARKRWFISSTSVPSKVQPIPNTRPFKLPGALVNCIVSDYQRFAKLAEEAGFDGIEIPVSDGSLLHNFLSPVVNTRTDRFGGSLDKRLEIIMRVLEGVRSNLSNPDRFAVSLRLCLHDLKEGGTTMAETLMVAEVLAKSGYIDMLNTSVGMHDSPVQTMACFVPQGTFTRSCQLVKQRLVAQGVTDIPVCVSHRIHSIAVAERVMAMKDCCDLIGIARPLLADAQFIAKCEAERAEDVLPCIACNHCVNRLYKHQRMTCALNPISGYELERSWRPTKFKKSVAVLGAGAAGVTCALTMWRRGHDVTLFEKGRVIGGQLNLAKVIPGKQSYQDVLEYWTRQLRQSSINVRMETEFTREEMARSHQLFHAIVMTVGSLPRRISSHVLPGASECKVLVPYENVLNGSVKAGRRVAIIGNGAIAYDVASFLLHDQRVSRSVDIFLDEWGVNLEDGTLLTEQSVTERALRNNRDVILFNKADKDADLSRGTGWSQKIWIRRHGGTIIKHGLIENFDSSGLFFSTVGPERYTYYVPCDTIVWCIGSLPNLAVGTWIYEWMKDGAKRRGEMTNSFSIYNAGSCRDSYTGDGHGEQDLLQAVHEGYEVGYKI